METDRCFILLLEFPNLTYLTGTKLDRSIEVKFKSLLSLWLRRTKQWTKLPSLKSSMLMLHYRALPDWSSGQVELRYAYASSHVYISFDHCKSIPPIESLQYSRAHRMRCWQLQRFVAQDLVYMVAAHEYTSSSHTIRDGVKLGIFLSFYYI